ncbi:MAG: SDR family NAD(P)-dependent oxidoreductase [Pseudomonadota bacterium]
MRVMIVGGSSGIGLALAQHYLAAGATLAICARHIERVPRALQDAYPQLRCYAVDIAERAALAQAIGEFGAPGLDLLIVTAGVYYNSRSHQLDADSTMAMLRTNVSGLAHAFELGAATMLARGSGQLVAIASVAGLLHDYPGASLYSATKRSVLSLCDSYRVGLAPFSIAVTAIVPGYVDTAKLRALNGGDASAKPFLLSEAAASAKIVDAIARRQAVRIFPWQMRCLIALLNHLPRALLRLRR